MKIYLKNFKCWESNIFEFNDKGVQLLSGESGKGKSSILDSIYFCLYGTLQKITTHKKTSCEVKLEYEDMIITRTKRPNRLVMIKNGNTFEDDIAQKQINEFFGDYFLFTSYVRQNINQTFLYMSPTEKLDFLENCVLKKYDVNSIKERLKDFFKITEKEIDVLSGQLQTYNEIFKTIEKPQDVIFPIKCSQKNIPIISKNEKVKKNNFSILLKRQLKEEDRINTDILKGININDKHRFLSEKLSEYEKRLKEYNTKLENITIDDHEQKQLEQKLQKIQIYKEYNTIKKRLEDEKNIYNKTLNDEKEKMSKLIREKELEIKDIDDKVLDKEITDLNKLYHDKLKIDELKNRLKEIDIPQVKYNTKDLETIQEQLSISKSQLEIASKLLKCPHCENSVIFQSGKLQKSSELNLEELGKNIELLKDKVKTIKNGIKTQQEYDDILKELSSLKDTDKSLKQLFSDIKIKKECYNFIINTKSELKSCKKIYDMDDYMILKRSRQIIENLTKKIDNFKDNISGFDVDPEDDEKLREKITMIKSNIKFRDEYLSNVEELSKNISKVKQELLKINVTNIVELKREKVKIETKKKELEIELEKSTKIVDKIELYDKYVIVRDKYNEIRDKITDITKILDKKKKELVNANILRESILQAESISIAQFIETINIHTQIYLDYFFKTDQIFVNIQTEKEMKKGSKTQINLDIDYKGNKVEIGNLSGGERDRLNLAFTLAFSEIFQSPILLLDECISSLDYENCSNVIQTIRDNYKGKSVICVHHQANEGLFDNLIKIN